MKAFPVLLFLVIFNSSAHALDVNQIAADDILFSEKLDLSPLTSIPIAKVESDLRILNQILSSIYPAQFLYGNGYLNELNQNILDIAKIKKSQSTDEVRNKICEIFKSHRDRHIQALSYSANGHWTGCYEKGENLIGDNIGANSDMPSIDSWVVEGKKILVLAIPNLEFSNSQYWAKYISAFKTQKESTDGILIDLRGNSGGSDEYSSQIIDSLSGQGGSNPGSKDWVANRDLEILKVLKLNQEFIDVIDSKTSKEERKLPVDWVNARTKLNHKIISVSDLKPEYDEELPSQKELIGEWKKPIVVLQDRNCFSSCEYAVESLGYLPSTVTIGQNTGGAYHLVWPVDLYLKNVRLRLYIPTRATTDYKGKNVEVIGLAPQIQVPTGTDALKVGLENLISKMK